MSGFGIVLKPILCLFFNKNLIALFVVNEKPRNGVLSLFVCPRVGNRTPGKEKNGKSPGLSPGGGGW